MNLSYVELYNNNKKLYMNLKADIHYQSAGGFNDDNIINSFNRRIEEYHTLCNKQKEIFSQSECEIFNNKTKDSYYYLEENGVTKKIKYITSGGQGAVYFMWVYDNIDVKEYGIAIKLVYIKPHLLDEKNMYKPYHKKWRELYVLKKCNNILKKRITQNLPFTYYDQICLNGNNKPCIVTYSELAKGNLLNWLGSEHSVDDWKGMIFQVWHGLYILQHELKLVHNDLRFPNILFIENEKTESSKYIVDNESYYLHDTKYVFMIWDFGSSELLEKSGDKYNSIKNKLESNIDLFFFHDMYNRLRVLCLMARYDMNDLEEILSDNPKDIDIEYVKTTKEENLKRFAKNRFEEKYTISLAYYIIETGRFEKYYEERKYQILENQTEYYLPPIEIDNIFKSLSENYNYEYDDIFKPDKIKSKRIPDFKELVQIFLPEFKEEHDYDMTFVCND